MNDAQDIYYAGTSQELFHDADLRPASVTSVEIQENRDGDDATAEVATTGVASIDAVDTTCNATSGKGRTDPRIVNLTTVAGIVKDRRYLITNTLGQYELGEVLDIGATSVTFRVPLKNEYLATSTFQGTRLTIALLDAWAAEESNVSATLDPNPRYRVRWEYVAGGVTVVRATMFDLVRYQGSHGVTGLDVDAAHPGFLDLLATRYRSDQGRSFIDAKYRQLKYRMFADEKADQMARNPGAIDQMLLELCWAEMLRDKLESGGNVTQEAVDSAEQRFDRNYNNMIREPNIPFATNSGGGAATSVPRAPLLNR